MGAMFCDFQVFLKVHYFCFLFMLVVSRVKPFTQGQQVSEFKVTVMFHAPTLVSYVDYTVPW